MTRGKKIKMMKYLKVSTILNTLLAIFVATAFVIGCTTDSKERGIEGTLPAGSKFIEHVTTISGRSDYVIFEFRGRCYMQYSNVQQRSVVEVNCSE